MKQIFILILTVTMIACQATSAPNQTPINGVTFFFLNGEKQGFPQVLAMQSKPEARAQLEALFSAYTEAGVNWIRLLVAADHFPASEYPRPSAKLTHQLIEFLDKLADHHFKVEIIFVAPQPKGLFSDAAPYPNDKIWFTAWLAALPRDKFNRIEIAGDVWPCALSPDGKVHCQGDGYQELNPISVNHGQWLSEMWPWFHKTYPDIPAGYETIANEVTGVSKGLFPVLTRWAEQHTPGLSDTSVSLYLELPAGSSAQDYQALVKSTLVDYQKATALPLWIDEYGLGVCLDTSCDYRASDQTAYFEGLLAETDGIPRFAWVAGRDYPYNGQRTYGLVTEFENDAPIFQPAWEAVRSAYSLVPQRNEKVAAP